MEQVFCCVTITTKTNKQQNQLGIWYHKHRSMCYVKLINFIISYTLFIKFVFKYIKDVGFTFRSLLSLFFNIGNGMYSLVVVLS